ncbi:MAG: helix-turn-helix transcriptional regulator [Desulfosalsimonadaceae bacterium]
MESHEFQRFRKKLKKTQEEMARLLGISVKAIRSYEQGWRSIPAHAERQLLFLCAKKDEIITPTKPCWTVNKCSKDRKEDCPAWEFQAGALCWFINGTICSGTDHQTWREKIEICKTCKAFPDGLKTILKAGQAIVEPPPHEECFHQAQTE